MLPVCNSTLPTPNFSHIVVTEAKAPSVVLQESVDYWTSQADHLPKTEKAGLLSIINRLARNISLKIDSLSKARCSSSIIKMNIENSLALLNQSARVFYQSKQSFIEERKNVEQRFLSLSQGVHDLNPPEFSSSQALAKETKSLYKEILDTHIPIIDHSESTTANHKHLLKRIQNIRHEIDTIDHMADTTGKSTLNPKIKMQKRSATCSPTLISPLFKDKLPRNHVPPNLSIHEIRGEKGVQSYIYIVKKDWNVNIYHRSDNINGFITHVFLSNNMDVRSAGQVLFINGKISMIDNCSGHYQPQGSLKLKKLTELAFASLGYNEALGKYYDKCSRIPSESIRREKQQIVSPVLEYWLYFGKIKIK